MYIKLQKKRSYNKIKKIKCFKKENQFIIYCLFLFLIGLIFQFFFCESNIILRCKDCNFVFVDFRSFISYNLCIYGYRVYCYYCSKLFKFQLGYNYYNNMKYGFGSEFFFCLICGKKFQFLSFVKWYMVCYLEN